MKHKGKRLTWTNVSLSVGLCIEKLKLLSFVSLFSCFWALLCSFCLSLSKPEY